MHCMCLPFFPFSCCTNGLPVLDKARLFVYQSKCVSSPFKKRPEVCFTDHCIGHVVMWRAGLNIHRTGLHLIISELALTARREKWVIPSWSHSLQSRSCRRESCMRFGKDRLGQRHRLTPGDASGLKSEELFLWDTECAHPLVCLEVLAPTLSHWSHWRPDHALSPFLSLALTSWPFSPTVSETYEPRLHPERAVLPSQG